MKAEEGREIRGVIKTKERREKEQRPVIKVISKAVRTQKDFYLLWSSNLKTNCIKSLYYTSSRRKSKLYIYPCAE